MKAVPKIRRRYMPGGMAFCLAFLMVSMGLLSACEASLSSFPEISRVTYFRLVDNVSSVYEGSYGYSAMEEGGHVMVSKKGLGQREDLMPCYEVDESFMDELAELLRGHGINRWDGFDKSSSGVLDGNSFSLSVSMEGGESIEAHGYANYPDGFDEFLKGAEALFDSAIQEAMGKKALLIDYYERPTGTEGSEPYYELVLYSHSEDELLLEEYIQGGSEDEKVRTYLVPFEAYQKAMTEIINYDLEYWDVSQDTSSLEGMLYVCRFSTLAGFTRVSSEKMPEDGGEAFKAISEALRDYAKDEYLSE